MPAKLFKNRYIRKKYITKEDEKANQNKIKAALKNNKERAFHVLSLIQLLYAIEAMARDQNLSHEQRHALRLEKSLPVINEIGTYINKHKGSVMPRSPLGMLLNIAKTDGQICKTI
jgi:uncharacterized protein YfiM (DUF2279 family)